MKRRKHEKSLGDFIKNEQSAVLTLICQYPNHIRDFPEMIIFVIGIRF